MMEKRFIDKVDMAPGCWTWMGATNGRYGVFSKSRIGLVGSRQVYAHRYMAQWLFGDLESKDVLHTCDNPLCVRPRHLFLGTHSDNMKDMISKGRNVGRLKLPRDTWLSLLGAPKSVIRTYGYSEKQINNLHNRRVKYVQSI